MPDLQPNFNIRTGGQPGDGKYEGKLSYDPGNIKETCNKRKDLVRSLIVEVKEVKNTMEDEDEEEDNDISSTGYYHRNSPRRRKLQNTTRRTSVKNETTTLGQNGQSNDG